jgi:hypothetical protein
MKQVFGKASVTLLLAGMATLGMGAAVIPAATAAQVSQAKVASNAHFVEPKPFRPGHSQSSKTDARRIYNNGQWPGRNWNSNGDWS